MLLEFSYQNEGSEFKKKLNQHSGYSIFEIKDKKLEGHYYTNKDRTDNRGCINHGEISAIKTTK